MEVNGTLTVNNDNSVGSIAGAGEISIAGGVTLTVGSNGSSTSFSGLISGDGSLTKEGVGTLTISGNNSYEGLTQITAGTLEADSENTLSQASDIDLSSLESSLVINNNNTIRSLSGSGGVSILDGATLTTGGLDTSYSGVIIGNGSFTKEEAGSLTLSGDNNYQGTTTISAGSIVTDAVDTLSSLSAHVIDSNGTLTINNNNSVPTISGAGNLGLTSGTLTLTGNGSTVFSGVISGSGNLTKTGSGTFTLSGNSSLYTGEISSSSGTLLCSGTLGQTSTTSIGVNGVLKGTGTLGNVEVSGTFQPGASIGTTTVAGNYIQSGGSTLEIEFNAAGDTDLVDVAGTTQIGDSTTLVLIPSAGSYTSGTIYTFLESDGLRTGTFDTVTLQNGNLGTLTPELTYTANTVFFTLTGEGGGSSVVLNSYMLPINRNLSQAISYLQLDNVEQRLNQFLLKSKPCYSKQCKKTAKKKSVENLKKSKRFFCRNKKSCNENAMKSQHLFTPFVQFGYFTAEVKPTDNNPAQKIKDYAPFLGVEYTYQSTFLLGSGFNYANSNTQDELKRGSINGNTYGFSLYTQYLPWNFLSFNLAGTTGWSVFDLSHQTASGDTARAKPKGWFVNSEFSINPLICVNRVLLKPIAMVKYNHIQTQSYGERSGDIRLNVNYDSVHSFNGEFGLSVAPEFFIKCSTFIPQFALTQIVPFNSNNREIYVGSLTDTTYNYTNIDDTNRYITKVSIGLSFLSKSKVNIYASSSYLINSGLKNAFEIFGGVGISF